MGAATQTEPGTQTREAIRELVADGEADPRVIADKVMPSLDDGEREYLLRLGLVEVAGHVLRSQRRYHAPDDDTPQLDLGQPQPSRKWQGVREASHDPTTWKVNVNGREDGWKVLVDCTLADVDAIAGMYMQRARANAEAGRRYKALADEMRQRGAATVGELSAEVFGRVMAR